MPGQAGPMLFLGREGEVSAMNMSLRRATNSEPQLVVVEGPAGIGKTCLVRRFLADIPPDGCLLQASGEENETHLPYAVVTQLIAHITERLDPLLEGLEHCARPGAAVPEPIAVGAGLLDAIDRFQERAPLVVVIDDAHWADTSSLHALTFVLRRLRVDRVMTVLVARDAGDPRLPPGLRRLLADDSTLKLRLEGFGVKELCQINAALGGEPLPRWAATRIREHTQGNPLHIKALLRQFPASAFVGSDVVLPAPRAYDRLIIARLNGCSPRTRRLVEAASVLGMASPLHLAARIGAVPDPLEALTEALERELLREEAATELPKAVFPHPFARAAVYQGLPPALRSQFHERAASLLVDDPAVALHHRARAAVAPDTDLADELGRFAVQQAEEGAWSPAAATMMAAARLSTDQAHRAQRFLQAVEHLLLAGDISQAAELEQFVRNLPRSAEQHYVLGHLALKCGRVDEARRELIACWESCGADVPTDTIRYATEQLAWLHLIEGDTQSAIAWSRRGLDIPPGKRSSFLRDSLAIGLALAGRFSEALQSLTHLSASGPRTCPAELEGLPARGLIQLWNGDLSAACRDLEEAFVSHRRRGLPYTALVSLGFLADAEYRAGRWDDAIAHGTQAVSLAEDADEVSILAPVHAFTACLLAGRGDCEAAEGHAKVATEQARVRSAISDITFAAIAVAHVRIAQGDHEGVVTALRPLLAPTIVHRDVLDEPGPLPWQTLLSEALVRTGRLDDAEAVLKDYEERAAGRDRWLDQAAAARCRGILEAARGHTDLADRAFQSGLSHCERGEPCWEQALLRLAYGTFLRRIGKRGAAVPQLEAAREVFHRLQATPYLDRCTTELTACGRAPRGPVDDAQHPALTAMELTVARLAVRGLTNRQIARELVLSTKTIEYHLGNAYAKLGISSRMGLVSQLPPES
ncbi:AAA family ATPase [Streptomyces sp. NPDC050315]|uniref:ATP-binding protein n=1 Tax=Streptomyces sp. NPDC050315 TaxID=3155039 RepID=UPI0034215141